MKESGSSQGGDGDLHPTGSRLSVPGWVAGGGAGLIVCLLLRVLVRRAAPWVGRPTATQGGAALSPGPAQPRQLAGSATTGLPPFGFLSCPQLTCGTKISDFFFFLQCTEWLSAVNQIEFGERVSHQPEASGVRAGNLRISI